MQISLKKELESIEYKDSDTLYVTALPHGHMAAVTLFHDGKIKIDSTLDSFVEAKEIIEENKDLSALFNHLKIMYFPLVKSILIKFVVKEDFYNFSDSNIVDNLALISISLDGVKELYPQITESINSTNYFKHPAILFVGRVSKIKEDIEANGDVVIENPYSNKNDLILV